MLLRDSGIDFVLRSRDQRLTTLVEVKSKRNTSSAWAAQFRRNRLAHGHASRGDFYLLVTRDRLYLWRVASGEVDSLEPSFEVDAGPIFSPYFQGTSISASTASPQAFELVVGSWLADLVGERESSPRFSAQGSWLVESGLLDAVVGGQVEYATAA
jgi:hypothetical protein